jgi:putative phosphoribosyl transferase
VEWLRGQDVVVLGLPRGGVPVAAEVAAALEAPLDVLVVRKLGLPFQPEAAMGAIGESGVRVLDDDLIARAQVTRQEIVDVERQERAVLSALVAVLRRGAPALDLHDRTAVIVDDGIATGSTARAACLVARRLGAPRVVLAVPVAPAGIVRSFRDADAFVCAHAPRRLEAVSRFYADFTPTSEDEVVRLLEAARLRVTGS